MQAYISVFAFQKKDHHGFLWDLNQKDKLEIVATLARQVLGARFKVLAT